MKENKTKIIGITGGIGSGKSIVCKIFEILGIPVYYADERAKWLTNNDLQLKKEIKELLGRNAYNEQGQYDRKWVASQVFNDPSLLKMLNMLIHPRVYEDTKQWVASHQEYPYLLKEAALTNAAGNGNDYNKIIVVSSPLELRIERTQKRDPQRTVEEIRAIIERQKSEQEFEQIADYHVFNNETQLVVPQILAIHQLLQH
jgi:dephospho-CoA kinase